MTLQKTWYIIHDNGLQIMFICCKGEIIMSKIRNIVVSMAIMGIINLPVCASSYEYVTVSPSSNEAGTTIESVGNSVSNTTLKTTVTKKTALNEEKAIQSNVSPEKYLSYTTQLEEFTNKRINKKYSKAVVTIKNISNEPLKFVWSQQNNDVTGQTVYENSLYYATIGSQCVAFIGGATIIGTPFAIYGATEMVKNKNAKLLNEINSYVKAGSVNWNAILQPNETMTVNLFKAKNQIEPITFKTRFTGNNDNFYTELNVKL